MPRKETRTYADRAEYMKLAVIKRRKKVRDMALEYKGGACQICSYNKSKRALSPTLKSLVFPTADSPALGTKQKPN
jgi:hypothetical protein